jgi:pimeloyl-ACP methyl ester carboxylesterase
MGASPPRPRRRVWRWIVASLVVLVGAGVVVWNSPRLLVPLAMRVAYMVQGVTDREVQVEGRSWGYLARGPEDGRPLLLIHGFGTSREAMMSLMPWMEESHRCAAPDLPGFGQHEFHEGQRHDADFYVDQLIAFTQALGWTRFDVMGTSMGGALATRLAARHPDRVERVVLLAPAGVRALKANAFMQAVDRGENPLDIASEADLDRVISLVFEEPPPMPWQFRAFLAGEAMRRRPATLRIVDAIKPFLLQGVEADLPMVLAPTLVVWGDRDRVTDPSMLRTFLAGLPRGTAALIPGAGHVVFADRPEEVRRTVVPFLRGEADPPRASP